MPIVYHKDITSNGKSNFFRIVMTTRKIANKRAVYAQELYEFDLKWKNFFKRITRETRFMQALEIQGHEVEVQVAKSEGANEAARRASEVAALKRGYGGRFDEFTAQELSDRMQAFTSDRKSVV